MATRGSRDDLVTDLENSAVAWHHFGKDTLRDQCFEAAQQLREGSAYADVGHTRYEARR